ncbi:porin family protein [Thalassotalea crassostreae]|uniref:porin family protein n=1 Tax=Thalassotalea crassostreae TaxID=1763536 RepID=UPI000838F9DD|nr:porin family protein [Thalassotalea crassostreae]
MKTRLIFATALMPIAALLSFSSTALANDEYGTFQPNQAYYMGAEFGLAVHNEESFENLSPSAMVARLGYNHSSSLSFELRYGGSLQEDDLTYFERELDSLMGIYAVYSFELNKKWNVYGLAGYSDIEVTSIFANRKVTDSDSGPSFGAGVEFKVNKRARWVFGGTGYVFNDLNYGTLNAGFRVSF